MPHPFFHLFLLPLFRLAYLIMLQPFPAPFPLSAGRGGNTCPSIGGCCPTHYALKSGNRCCQMCIFSLGKVQLRPVNWNVPNDKPYQTETIWLLEKYHVYKIPSQKPASNVLSGRALLNSLCLLLSPFASSLIKNTLAISQRPRCGILTLWFYTSRYMRT